LKVIEQGILNSGEAGTGRAISTGASVASPADGTLLATYRVGSTKDSADGTVELRRSVDGGRTWSDPETPFETTFDGVRGSVRLAYITWLEGDHLLAAGLWIDRTAYPGQPLFNDETEGCLPMKVLLSDSNDLGRTWSPWRELPVPEDAGPPSLTNPVLRLASGRLAISIETNKTYEDPGPWYQRVVYCYSDDQGRTWSAPVTTCQDPAARIFHWDQRAAVCPDGRIVTYSWTYDRESCRYLNIQRRFSPDEGATWSEPEDLGFADQASHPAILEDGRTVLAWVDRFGSQSIRARLAPDVDGPFPAESEVELYRLETSPGSNVGAGDTGELLAQMGNWNYGLPYAEVLKDGDVIVVHYEGTSSAMRICWSRLSVSEK